MKHEVDQGRRRRVKRVGWVVIGLLFLLAAVLGAEAYFRFIDPYPRSFFAYDSQLIWRLKRDFRGMKRWGDDHFPLQFNSQGFRVAPDTDDGDWDLQTPTGRRRIMVLGDSYTAALDVRYEDTFSSILKQRLNEIGGGETSYEVLNAGCPAWGTDQEYIFWMNEGIRYRPDYLLLVVAPNDLREMYQKKLVTLDTKGKPVIHPVQYPRSARLGWWLSNRSSFYQYLQKRWLNTHYGHFFDIFRHYPVDFGKGDEGNWDLPLFLREPFAEVAEARRLFRVLIEQIHKSCQQQDIQLLLSIIPTKMEFDGSLDTTLYQPGTVAALLGEIAAEHDIPYLNLYERVHNSPDPMEMFLSWDFHMNEAGNLYLGEALTELFAD